MIAGAGARRVALVTAASEAGGAERLIETLAAHFDRQIVTPVLAAPEGRLLQRWQALGLETCALPTFGRMRRVDLGAKAVSEIRRRLSRARIDIVHSHGVSAHIHAGLAARRMGRPAVYHAHDLFESSWSADGALQRFALRVTAARVIAVSETVAASLHGRVAPGALRTILNGVEADVVQPVPNLPGPLVVWCGRLQQWKGPHHFIAAAKAIKAARPETNFAVVGGTLFGLEPAYRDFLERQVAEAGLENSINFVGQVDDARPWLRAASVVVHCADRPEPFGLVMAEAMMQERPVVAFRQGGAAEIVIDGETGRLVAPRDSAALAAAVVGLLADDAARQAMGAAGRRRAEREFDAARMTAAVTAVYDAMGTADE